MDKIQTTKERIFIFLEKKEIRKEAFYKATGMSSSNFKGNALKSDLGVDKLAKILTVYPELNYNENLLWLVTGEGELNIEIKKNQQNAGLNIIKSGEEQVGDLLASLFAQYNTQDKGILFIQNQIKRMEQKYDEAFKKQNKQLQEIIELAKLINK